MEAPPAGAENTIAVIICAAGSSRRMKGLKKEYRPLPGAGGLTVLGAAVSAFLPLVETVVIAVPADAGTGEAAARRALPPELLAGEGRIRFVSGGNTRRESVHRGLSLLAARPPRYVLIHDGARPWITAALIERVIEAVQKYRAVIPLLPLTETPKETDSPVGAGGAVFIKRHLRRVLTGAAQTPQAFAFPEILAAHERAAECERDGAEYTDDAELWGAFVGPVAAIPGSPENRKITFPEDLW